MASVGGKDICRATCLHPNFVNGPLTCVQKRQNTASSVYFAFNETVPFYGPGTGLNLGGVTGWVTDLLCWAWVGPSHKNVSP